MLSNSWFKKEKPLPGMIGFGGGAAGLVQGGAPLASGVSATGGTTNPYTDPGGVTWTAHKFTGPGTFSVSAADGTGLIEYLVVGGGGGGAG